MPHVSPSPLKQIIAVSTAVPVLALALTSAVCMVRASQNGARMEAAITAAHAAVTKHDEILRDTLASVTGIDNLTVHDAKYAVFLTERRQGAEGGRIAILRLSENYGRALGWRGGVVAGRQLVVTPESAAAVANAALQYTAKVYAYQNALTQAKTAYSSELSSNWTGMWLHLVGYPKIVLSDTKVHSGKPKVGSTREQAVTSAPPSAPQSSVPAPGQ